MARRSLKWEGIGKECGKVWQEMGGKEWEFIRELMESKQWEFSFVSFPEKFPKSFGRN